MRRGSSRRQLTSSSRRYSNGSIFRGAIPLDSQINRLFACSHPESYLPPRAVMEGWAGPAWALAHSSLSPWEKKAANILRSTPVAGLTLAHDILFSPGDANTANGHPYGSPPTALWSIFTSPCPFRHSSAPFRGVVYERQGVGAASPSPPTFKTNRPGPIIRTCSYWTQ